MRIGFDQSPVQNSHAGRGIGYYTKYLMTALENIPNIEIVKFVGDPNKCDPVDLVHIPYFDIFKRSLPMLKRYKTIITIHDLIPVAYSDHFAAGIRGSISWQLQRQSAQGCAHVITDSQASKSDIIRYVGISDNKVSVIQLAPAEQFSSSVNFNSISIAKEYYHLPDTFFLYVGDINWNKNVLGLIDAYASLDDDIRQKVHLVCLGRAFTNIEIPEMAQIAAKIRQYDIADYVHMPGRVDDQHIPALYQAALCLVQPSFAEGFGLPVLEAMASGCPVVCSKRASLAEIAGPSITVAPDSDSIAKGLKQILSLTPTQREKMIQLGITWAKQFNWNNTAQQTIEVYKKVLAQE